MNAPSIGFIGGGRVVKILLGGWARANDLPERIVVADIDPSALGRLIEKHPSIEVVGAEIARAVAQDVVFLALHPPAIAEALSGLRVAVRPDGLLVSLAPKFTIRRLSELLGGFSRIARVIPNAASIVGVGFNPIAFGQEISGSDRAVLIKLLGPLGKCPEVTEECLEAYAVVTAMGPTYFWPQLYELQSLAVRFGLDPAAATEAVRDMIAGALVIMESSGLTPGDVQDLIPVKPLGDLQPALLEGYRTRLSAVMEKIRPT